MWLFLFGPGPVFLLVCFLGDETQVWLGDLRVVSFCGVVFVCCDLICLCIGAGQLRYVPLFSPLMFLSGPCHRAFTAKLEGKKNTERE